MLEEGGNYIYGYTLYKELSQFLDTGSGFTGIWIPPKMGDLQLFKAISLIMSQAHPEGLQSSQGKPSDHQQAETLGMTH